MKKPPQLTPRLEAVARLIPDCRTFADIGTDHAYLPVWLCMQGVCKNAIASDINKGPLERAKTTVDEYGLNDKISLRLGGGLDTLEPGEADAVSIAGMGGLMIADILNSGRDKLTKATQIVIQPMSSIPELRGILLRSGWEITGELLAKEDKKLYHIMSAAPSDTASEPNALDIYIGRALIEAKPPHFGEYIQNERNKLNAVIKGLKAAKNENPEKLNTALALLEELDRI